MYNAVYSCIHVQCSVLQYVLTVMCTYRQCIVVMYRTAWDQAALLDGVEDVQCVWVKIDLAVLSDRFHIIFVICKKNLFSIIFWKK